MAKARLNTKGAILIEFALIMPILVFMLMGMIDYTQYIRAKERMQRSADDLGSLLSAVPPTNSGVSWRATVENILGRGANTGLDANYPISPASIAAPYGAQINVVFCTSGDANPVYEYIYKTSKETRTDAKYIIATDRCGDDVGTGYDKLACIFPVSSVTGKPYVVVRSACKFRGIFNKMVLPFLQDGGQKSSTLFNFFDSVVSSNPRSSQMTNVNDLGS